MTWETLTAVAVIGLVGAMATAQVVNPHVSTDKSIDTSTMKSLVRDVCVGKKTEQEKAIALFYYGRRTMFPYPNRPGGGAIHDAGHLINTYGYSFCSQQAVTTTTLWKAAGINGEILSVPGHVTMQAEYGGSKHWFDLLIGAFVYERDGKTIASIEDIAADPTLLTKAVAEKRAPEAFVPARIVLKGDAARFCKHNPKYVKECDAYEDDVDYMAKTAKLAKRPSWARVTAKSGYKYGMTLRKGESITWLWDFIPGQANANVLRKKDGPRNYWVREADLPPHHIYGEEAEKRDTINYKYWKPYTKVVQGVRTGRYAANGRVVYDVDLSVRPTKAVFGSNTFTWAAAKADAPALQVAASDKTSELICVTKTPHIWTGGKVTVELFLAKADDLATVSVFGRWWERKRGMVKDYKEVWTSAGKTLKVGKNTVEIDMGKAPRGQRELKVKIECMTRGEAAKAGLGAVKIEGIFQHSMYSRPHLVAGDNKVTVQLAEAVPAKQDFQVTYAWEEGGKKETNVKKVTAATTNYTIKVGGKEEIPRMLYLKMALAK